ncbi:glycosyltransferase family 4 protein [Arhodomonas sp. AD133]|uniref:glycosyltransferase family 4 protein n=1 Tax=Arhodomonas sp. AD133 TaxID=3415009 RepID=UPI003EBA6E7F
MRIVIVTDAWKPQVNGVVTTLSRVSEQLRRQGHEVRLITPEGRRTWPMPGYPEIRLTRRPGAAVASELDAIAPQAVHIATEGPLGMAARRHCLRRRWPFTTAWHTQFPQYVRLRLPVPEAWTYRLLRRFHDPAERTLVPTPSMRDELAAHGFRHLLVWSRGVDTSVFHPGYADVFADLPRPVSIYVGRVAVEKNLEAFLSLPAAGTKVVVGDGPDRAGLQARYPHAVFTGYRYGEDLAASISSADVFVFPSRTDTYGLTMLEAMACGTPVAAYPVTGPRDVVEEGVTGALDEDLGAAVARALQLPPEAAIAYAGARTWDACAEALRAALAPIGGGGPQDAVADELPD